jgi:hypothetical protein
VLTVVGGVGIYLLGWASAAACGLSKEADLEREIRRLSLELRDARVDAAVNRQRWQ